MLTFLSNFFLLLVFLAGAGLVGWLVVRFLRHGHGRHRGRRRHRTVKQAMTSWLPIATFHDTEPETARVLLWADGEARFGRYDESCACWREQADGDRCEPIHPTHWMPLPRPPGS